MKVETGLAKGSSKESSHRRLARDGSGRGQADERNHGNHLPLGGHGCRGQWTIEKDFHDIPDWNYDQDRSHIRTGHGPENVTRLRRFAVSVIKSKVAGSVAQIIRGLTRHVRWVFDYLRVTENSGA